MVSAQVRRLELGKSAFVMAIDGARRAVWAIGDELVAAGPATDRDDAFYLTFEELSGPLPADAAELIRHRRACRERHAALSLPMTWTGMPVPDAAPGADPPPGPVTGVGAGGGRVEGTVRVVHDPATDPFEPDEVLVCRFTDPGWAPLFGLAAAVVIDVGGMASHGAVVARELGIPCVIGTGDGTRVLRDGQRVRWTGRWAG